MTLDPQIGSRLSLPLIVAPMTGVSSLELVIECCRHGLIGSFPTHAATTPQELGRWYRQIAAARDRASSAAFAPAAANLVVHPSNRRLADDVDVLARNAAEIVITSVGSPEQSWPPCTTLAAPC